MIKQTKEKIMKTDATNEELKQELIKTKEEVAVLRYIRKHYEDKFGIRMYANGQFETIEEA